MLKRYTKRWIYASTATIFFFVAVMNFWMILKNRLTHFRIIAVVAFMLGGIIFLVRVIRSGMSDDE